jgi:F-type H+-transporting ATPase subunit b
VNAVIAQVLVPLLQHLPRAEGDLDDSGNFTTTNWLIPEQAELIYGGIASAIIIAVLVWKAGPMARKAFDDRTARIEQELEESSQDQAQAEAKASQVRAALGDIESERRRILADADAQAESLLTDGRARLEAEIAELDAKTEADIAAARGRVSDELRAEISRYATAAAERVVERSLDDASQQQLIEDYIQRVGRESQQVDA